MIAIPLAFPDPVVDEMQIQLNGEPRQFTQEQSIAELLEILQLTERRLAVELNGEILPRSEYTQKILKPDDCLEIVHAIGGGQSETP